MRRDIARLLAKPIATATVEVNEIHDSSNTSSNGWFLPRSGMSTDISFTSPIPMPKGIERKKESVKVNAVRRANRVISGREIAAAAMKK